MIISLLAPEDDLSIQVHPDDDYASTLGLEHGKNEAWYFIESKPNSSIVYGHNAADLQEMTEYVAKGKWNELIRVLPVTTDDFVYLPAGLLHAMKKGSIVYEIQQATDITYRFYDYDRHDNKGHKRKLHLSDALACLSYDQMALENPLTPMLKKRDGYEETVFIDNDSFTVIKLDIKSECHYKSRNYQLATVVKGAGWVDGCPVEVGTNFLIPVNTKVVIAGNLIVMLATA